MIFPTKPMAPEPGGQAAITWSKIFPGTPEQVGKARRFLAAILEGCLAADDAALCLSELVSDASCTAGLGSLGGSSRSRPS